MARMRTKPDVENVGGIDPTKVKPNAKRQHKATYARDKRNGGYLIRVEGPNAGRFINRQVPVVTRDDKEHNEKLTNLIWAGINQETGSPVALYRFESKPRADFDDEIPF